jgi:hypothetical protein
VKNVVACCFELSWPSWWQKKPKPWVVDNDDDVDVDDYGETLLGPMAAS